MRNRSKEDFEFERLNEENAIKKNIMANSSLYSYMYFTLFVLAPLLRQTKVETTGTKMEGNTRRSLEHVHVHVSVTLLPVLGVNRKNSHTCILKRGSLCALKHIPAIC